MTDRWVIDATMGANDGMFCFCPIEGDPQGKYTVVTGMSYFSDTPPGELVAIVHEDGQEAVEAFCEEHADELGKLKERLT